MNLNIIELLWLFLTYSLLGWFLETIAAAVKHKHFANKGLINGPLCIIYGVTTVTVTIFFHELTGIWLFVAASLMAALIEWTAGHMIEKFFHEKWWDYSKHKWNLDGYISLPMSILWGFLCSFAVAWANGLLLKLYHMIPALAGKIIVWVILGLLTLDVLATVIILQGRSKNLERWENIDAWMDSLSSALSRGIYRNVNKRIVKAYPEAVHKSAEEKNPQVFWDYSSMPFNLGGRINLLYCFFWGFAAVVWIKFCYPKISAWIEKIPVKPGKIITWITLVFMICNIAVSCMALVRVNERSNGIPAKSSWQQVMDERFDDERMHHIYPNAVHVN